MIYGVTIILNDVNFSLKDRSKQVQTRYHFQSFFTNKTRALQAYDWQSKRVMNELSVCYGKYELRGRCEIYKATINEGMIMEHGTIIKEIKI